MKSRKIRKIRQIRQGDVLVNYVSNLPTAAAPVENKDRIVLAHGEVTGHAHAVRADTATELATTTERFLKLVGDKAKLKHEEHGTIGLPPGIGQIIQQREYSPEAIRNVAD